MEFSINGLKQRRQKQRKKPPLATISFRALCGATAICALFTVRTSAQGSQGSKECSTYTSTPQAALAYLKQDRATLRPRCIREAIEVLRSNELRLEARRTGESKAVIDVLFKYLDFAPAEHPTMDASMPTNRIYPAADALCSFGTIVLPRVKQVIQNDNETPVARLNAAKIYFALARGPETIRFIVQAARHANDPGATTKLIQFADDAVPYCSEQQRPECENALGP